MVKAGRRATPPIPPPRQLVPVVRFAKLPDRALHTVATVLDEDGELRGRIVEALEGRDADLGRAGVLFLVRPEGWERELAALAATARERDLDRRSEADDRSASRRLAAVEEEARVLSEALAATRDRGAETAAALASERAAHAEAKAALADAQRRIVQLENERDAAHRRVAAADRELASVRAQLEEAARERDERAAAAARRHVDELAPDVTRTLDEARRAVADLQAALGRAADAFADIPAAVDEVPAAAGRPRPAPRRRAAPVPAGLAADALETAEHLVRLPRAILLVDGYNASLRVWDDQPLSVQRERLVAAAEELSARAGVEIHVIFDGSEEEPSLATRSRRLGVEVRFTPSHIEADDAILDLIGTFPLDRPVLVASDDHRVRDGADQRGANVLTQRQLFAVLRRERT